MKVSWIKAYSWIVLCCISFIIVNARSIRKNEDNFVCSRTMPCGWEVYQQYKRTPEYFVKSPCQCPTGTKCTQSSDDISISAYVYRCAKEN